MLKRCRNPREGERCSCAVASCPSRTLAGFWSCSNGGLYTPELTCALNPPADVIGPSCQVMSIARAGWAILLPFLGGGNCSNAGDQINQQSMDFFFTVFLLVWYIKFFKRDSRRRSRYRASLRLALTELDSTP